MPGRRKGPGARNAVSGQPAGPDGQPAPVGSSLFVPGYSSGLPPTGDTGRQAAVRADGGWRGAVTGTAAKGPVRGFPPGPGQPPPVYPPGQFSAWNRAGRPAGDDLLDGSRAADAWEPADYSEPAAYDPAGPWPPAPGYADPGYDGPGYDGTGSGATGYSGPGYSGPGYSGPGYSEPGYTSLVMAILVMASPGYGDPGYGDPGYGDPGYSVLAVSDPAADVTATQSWKVVDASRGTPGWADPGAPAWPSRAERTDGAPAVQTEHPPPGATGLAGRTDTGRTDTARTDTAGPTTGRTDTGRTDTGGPTPGEPAPGEPARLTARTPSGPAGPGPKRAATGCRGHGPVPAARPAIPPACRRPRPAPGRALTVRGPTGRPAGARTPGRVVRSGRAACYSPAGWSWPWWQAGPRTSG